MEFRLLLCYAVAFLLLWVPALLLARSWCGHKGRTTPLVDITALMIVMATGYMVFWVSLLAPALGACVSGLYFLGGAVWAILSFRNRRVKCADLCSRPVAVGVLFGLLYLSGMSLFGGVESEPIWFVPETGVDPPSAVFWLQPRSIDSLIPLKFAFAVARQRPLRGDTGFGGWNFSDRPPVQTGVLLLSWPLTYVFGVGVVNLAVGTLLQVQWVMAVFAVVWVMGGSSKRMTFVVIVVGATGFIYYSSVYVWPKLLSAALWLAGSVPLVEAWRQARTPTMRERLVSGASWALAFLSHGGIGFSLLPAAFLILLYRPFRSWRFWLPCCAIAGALYAPWMAYQKYFDPPGDRCLRLMFAGQGAIDERHWIHPTLEAYKRLTFNNFLYRLKKNAELLFRDPHLDHNITVCLKGMIHPDQVPMDSTQGFRTRYYADRSRLACDLPTLAALVRYDQVEETFRALGILNLSWPILGWFALRSRWRYLREKILGLVLLQTFLSLVLWWLLIYREGHLLIRNASYGMMLGLLIVGAHVLYDTPKPIRNGLFVAHLLFNTVVWVVFVPTDFGRKLLHLQSHPCWPSLVGLLLGIAGLVGLTRLGATSGWWPRPFSIK